MVPASPFVIVTPRGTGPGRPLGRHAQLLAAPRQAGTDGSDPDADELLEPYAPLYFEAVSEVWRDWSSAMAQDFVSGAYGICPVTAETVAATDRYITASAPPAALRRLQNGSFCGTASNRRDGASG